MIDDSPTPAQLSDEVTNEAEPLAQPARPAHSARDESASHGSSNCGMTASLDIEPFAREIRRVAPWLFPADVTFLGTGQDNWAFLVGDQFVFRFPKHAEAAQQLETEIRLLPALAPRLKLPIPRYQYLGRQTDTDLPFVGYRLILGEELTRERAAQLTREARDRVARELSEFIVAVCSFPVEEARAMGVRDSDLRQTIIADLEEARRKLYPIVDASVREYLERTFQRYLDDAANFEYEPALLHSDYAPEHVLVRPDGGGLAGIIDFDPVIDDPDWEWLYPFWLGLGDAALRYALHPAPEQLMQKLAFADTLEIVADALHDIALGNTASLTARLGALRAKANGADGQFLS
jgi:aminoglycoside 2''-phosphotransferase